MIRFRHRVERCVVIGAMVLAGWPCLAQPPAEPKAPPSEPAPKADAPQRETPAPAPAHDVSGAISRGIAILLERQEGDSKAEWPYEGVYRVGGKIPIGYRVGGTAIAALALIEAPGYGEDAGRREAVARAVDFIIKAAEDPLMLPDYDGGYDVRGWGYTYGLALFLRLKALNAFPAGREDAADGLIRQNINAIQLTAIREVGGWNYARPVGRELVAPPSTFMTAPTVLALLDAKAAGYAVDEETLGRAVESLERARTPVGGVVYSGAAEKRQREAVPGAVGRMLVTEVTLMKVGRSDLVRVRGALDAFFTHWSWLDQRRAKPGTHVGPYAIAPYYFYYAHRYAAQAIEMLPKTERNEYRRRLHELLFSVRLEDGSWNDRVFPRSAAYGTSMVMLALIDMQGAEENPK